MSSASSVKVPAGPKYATRGTSRIVGEAPVRRRAGFAAAAPAAGRATWIAR